MSYEQLKKLLIDHEGLRLKVYQDTKNIPTIGVGRNLISKGISKNEAISLLGNDIDDIKYFLSTRFSGLWETLGDVRQAVCIDMAFAVGNEGFLKFHDFISDMVSKDYTKAAQEILKSDFAKGAKNRAYDLYIMMKTGQWRA